MSVDTPRHDLFVEESIIGWCIHNTRDFDEIAERISVGDFYGDNNASLFDLLCDLRQHGSDLSMQAVAMEATRREVPIRAGDLIRMQNHSATNWKRTCELLINYRVERDLEALGSELKVIARDPTLSPDEKLDRSQQRLDRIELPVHDVSTLSDFYRLPEYLALNDKPAPWVIPGMMRAGWRCMVVAGEGVGKSTLFRQIATAASQGIHPLAQTCIPPVRTMLVDLENPRDVIQETLGRMNSRAIQDAEDYDGDRWALWEKPGGINLRTRRDQTEFEARVLDGRPDLVCLGPLYKSYQSNVRDGGDEQAAREVQAFIDKLREKHHFALILEHHAPKAQGGTRDLSPFGTSLWSRWPDMGINLKAKVDGTPSESLVLGTFRGNRVVAFWPDRIDRGGYHEMPWVGYWADPSAAAPVGALPYGSGVQRNGHATDLDDVGAKGF